MVDTRSTANSDSNQRETTILENIHQCSSAPTESLSEEKPQTLQEQKMLESSKMTITDEVHFHLEYLNSSIDDSEDLDILQETVEEIKEKQRKLETVVSQLIILIDPSEQSNCSREHSRLKIEVKKFIDNFKKICQREVTDKYWRGLQSQCWCHQKTELSAGQLYFSIYQPSSTSS